MSIVSDESRRENSLTRMTSSDHQISVWHFIQAKKSKLNERRQMRERWTCETNILYIRLEFGGTLSIWRWNVVDWEVDGRQLPSESWNLDRTECWHAEFRRDEKTTNWNSKLVELVVLHRDSSDRFDERCRVRLFRASNCLRWSPYLSKDEVAPANEVVGIVDSNLCYSNYSLFLFGMVLLISPCRQKVTMIHLQMYSMSELSAVFD